MKDKTSFAPPVVGASSLLVIFAVLCLVVFALLSVSTVQANGRLSDHAAKAVADYYDADTQAERILAKLRAGESPEGVSQQGNLYTYTCTVSDTQVLAVQVMVENDNYTILRWQIISDVRWQADDKRPVWDGLG